MLTRDVSLARVSRGFVSLQTTRSMVYYSVFAVSRSLFVSQYLGYLLESGTITAKSPQPYLSAINSVHNDLEYPPPACEHLVKLVRKGFAEL